MLPESAELVLMILAFIDQVDFLFKRRGDDDYLTAVRALDGIFIFKSVHEAFLDSCYFY